jgi:carbonic anhydrase/acetyltransferase-like protein (isoleucine patch superfamily)
MEMDIHRSAFIAENATIVGAVCVEALASVWYGAVLRGDSGYIHIGTQSHVEDNVVVHGKTTLGQGVIVGHGAVLHSCTIEANCLIGMNATIMDGVVIGTGSLVAAGSVVTKDMHIPPESLVMGCPAEIVNSTSKKQMEFIISGAQEYIGLARLQLPQYTEGESL